MRFFIGCIQRCPHHEHSIIQWVAVFVVSPSFVPLQITNPTQQTGHFVGGLTSSVLTDPLSEIHGDDHIAA